MKKRLAGAAAGLMLLGGAMSVHAAEVSGNVLIGSDYSLRGISQTDRDPTIQGGFDVAFDSGFYLGTWASNVSFGDVSMEWDLYVGYAGSITEDVGYDLSYIRFEYPGLGSVLDYNEFHAILNWGDFSFGVGYSPDYLGLNNVDWWYPNASYTLGLPSETSLAFTLGYSMLNDNSAEDFTALFGGEEILDWSVTYTIPVAGVDLGIGVVGTDIGRNKCLGGEKACSTRAVVSLSKSL